MKRHGISGLLQGRLLGGNKLRDGCWRKTLWKREFEKELQDSGHFRKWFPAKTLLDNDGGDSQLLAVSPTKVTGRKQ